MITQYYLYGYPVFALAPNCSANWQQNKRLLLCISVPCLFIAFLSAIRGGWVVLPFVAFALGLLGFHMHRVCYRNFRRVLIVVERQYIKVIGGTVESEFKFVFNRNNTRLGIKPSQFPYDSISIRLVDPIKSVDVGEFLNSNDRERLRQKLKGIGIIEFID